MTIHVKKLKSWKDKSIGLLQAEKAYPILINTRIGIHTFGMKFPIDVLILDKYGVVRSLAEYLNPNRIFIWNPSFDTVIELPAGMISKNGIKVNQKINLTF